MILGWLDWAIKPAAPCRVKYLSLVRFTFGSTSGERRDRSILFWKSQPVSDLTAVLSKMSVPMVVLPVIAVGLTVVTHLIMLMGRAALLWALVPIVAVAVIEKVAFNTVHFANWLEFRLGGAPGAGAYPGSHMATHAWAHLSAGQFLLSPGLWSGLILAALLLVGAARMRRNRGPM
jgi:ABC-2 type transport system permease protein